VIPRLAALALAGWLVAFTTGCGHYGPPKRYPSVSEPAAEQATEPEAVESEQ